MRSLAVMMLALGSTVALADRAPPPAPQPPGNDRLPQREVADPFLNGFGGSGIAVRMPPRPVQPDIVVAPEMAARAKLIAGNYTCKGVTMLSDGSSRPLQATLAIKLDLGIAWIQMSWVQTTPPATRWTDYRTYDAVAKQWTRIALASTSSHVASTSLGEKGGAWIWEGTATSPAGTLQVRDHEEYGSKLIKVWGEALMSGSWQKVYEATCRR